MTKRAILTLGAGLGAAVLSTVLPGASTPAGAEAVVPFQTGRASAAASLQGSNKASDEVALSADGRFLAFQSASTDLVAADTSTATSIYRKDRYTGAVVLVSVRPDGKDGNGAAGTPSISNDGRYVAFASSSNDLVAGDTNGLTDVFVRDLSVGKTERISVSSAEGQALGGPSGALDQAAGIDLSSTGRYVVFPSAATNLVGSDSNGVNDVFLRDRSLGTTERVSISDAEAQATGVSVEGTVSDDGRYVAFSSVATKLVPADDNALVDVFRRDRTQGTTTWVSLSNTEAEPDGYSVDPSISGNGAKVAFTSAAVNLVTSDTNGKLDVFVRDLSASSTTRVSTQGPGGQALGDSSNAAISTDGATVAFTTDAKLVAGDTNGDFDVYTHTHATSTTVRRSLRSDGVGVPFDSYNPAISADGSTVGFTSSGQYAGGDTNATADVFWNRTLRMGPYTNVDAFVGRQHQDFGGPGSSVNPSVEDILNGRSVERLVADLATTYGAKRSPVIRLYLAYFQRNPDTGGITYWADKAAKGTGLNAISQEFAKSSEFKAKYGNTTDSQFVSLVYQNVLARSADAAGLSHWVKKLQGGMSRGAVMTNFSESSEGVRRLSKWSGIVLLSLGMLHRVPTQAQFAAGSAVLEGQPLEVGVRFVLDSADYADTVA